MPLYLSFSGEFRVNSNSGDSIPVSPSLDPLPSVCVPASLQALDKALRAQEAAGAAVLADLRDRLVHQAAAAPARKRAQLGMRRSRGVA